MKRKQKSLFKLSYLSHLLTDLADPQASGTQDRFRLSLACPQFERPAHRFYVSLSQIG
jgi:hypothetical protein